MFDNINVKEIEMSEKSSKSKNQSPLEYFDTLQKEYFVAEIRRKIYPSIRDKEYYKMLMERKKDKIQNISIRNRLDSIFTSDEVKMKYMQLVYPDRGLPKFDVCEKDIKNYYMTGSDVRFEINSVKYLGKIEDVNFINNTALVKIRGEKDRKYLKLHDITRIL